SSTSQRAPAVQDQAGASGRTAFGNIRGRDDGRGTLARVTDPIPVLVLLIGVREVRTVVTRVTDPVVIPVALVGIGDVRAIVEGACVRRMTRVAKAIAIGIDAGIELIRNTVAIDIVQTVQGDEEAVLVDSRQVGGPIAVEVGDHETEVSEINP